MRAFVAPRLEVLKVVQGEKHSPNQKQMVGTCWNPEKSSILYSKRLGLGSFIHVFLVVFFLVFLSR